MLDRESTIREWLADPRGQAVITPLFQRMEAMSREVFVAAENNTEAIGMNMMDMFMDMPILSVLMFQQEALTMPADEMVDGLLAQVHGQQVKPLRGDFWNRGFRRPR